MHVASTEQKPDFTYNFSLCSNHFRPLTRKVLLSNGLSEEYFDQMMALLICLNENGSLILKELVIENKILRQKVAKKYEIIGKSKPIMEVHSMVDKVAKTEARVLITGDSGTGKELVAHNIHERSGRNKSPFIEVNCAAIPSELIESELFGHLKGSFTSDVKDLLGYFEASINGS